MIFAKFSVEDDFPEGLTVNIIAIGGNLVTSISESDSKFRYFSTSLVEKESLKIGFWVRWDGKIFDLAVCPNT